MFEFLMLIGFLGAGLCHLLPATEGENAGRNNAPAKEGENEERTSRASRRFDPGAPKKKNPANARRPAGQGPFPWAA
jgi:hypothetical protein